MKTSNNKIWIYIFMTVYLYVANLYGVIPMLVSALLVFSAYIIYNKCIIQYSVDQRLLLYFGIFSLFCVSSSLWANDFRVAIDMGIRMVEISAITLLFYICVKSDEKLEGLLKAIMYSGYGISIYVLAVAGWDVIVRLVMTAQRITFHQIDTLNANTIGALAAYSLVINMYLLIYKQKKITFLDLLMIPGVMTLMASQSRKAYATLALGIILLLIMKNFSLKTKNEIFKSVFFIIMIVIVIYMAFITFSDNAVFALINERFLSLIESFRGGKGDATLRIDYMKLGIEIFKSSPIVGVGVDNAKVINGAVSGHNVYLHNNYVELLAGLGIVGFVMYYSIFGIILYKFYKLRNYRDSEYDICLILLMLRLIMDFGQITYYGKDNAIYIMLFWLMVNKLEKRRDYAEALIISNKD